MTDLYSDKAFEDDFEDDFPPFPRPIRITRKQWCCTGINQVVEPNCVNQVDGSFDWVFTPKYLIVSTSGFHIHRFHIGNYMILCDVDADIFYRANWDRLARKNELDRVKLYEVKASPAYKWVLHLSHRGTKPVQFRAALIGESEESSWPRL
jgi:hypothetical protein